MLRPLAAVVAIAALAWSTIFLFAFDSPVAALVTASALMGSVAALALWSRGFLRPGLHLLCFSLMMIASFLLLLIVDSHRSPRLAGRYLLCRPDRVLLFASAVLPGPGSSHHRHCGVSHQLAAHLRLHVHVLLLLYRSLCVPGCVRVGFE